MTALRPANTNTRPSAFKRGSAGLPSSSMHAVRGNGSACASRQSANAREDGEASASPLRPLIESLDRVLERLIDSRAQDAIEGRHPWTRPETPRPGERI